MKPASHADGTMAAGDELERWFLGPSGSRLAEAEADILHRFVENLFGYHLVSVRNCGVGADCLESCPVRNKLILCTDARNDGCDLRARAEQLPLKTDSLDAVVLRHTLDFATDPHQVLREVDRILIPDGRVLIVGFNPVSIWGLWRMVLKWRGRAPWCGHFLPYRRVADWLHLLGFDIEYTDVAAFAPPLPEKWHARLGGLERLGRRALPMFAGVYVIRAVKRVSRVTPIRLRWHGLRVLSPGGLVEPSARQGLVNEKGTFHR